MLFSETSAVSPLFSLVPWVVFFPLLGILVNLVFGRRLSRPLIGAIASLASGLSFGVAVLLAVALAGHPEGATVSLGDWMRAGNIHLTWSFKVDTLAATMMLVVSGVGTLIHVYAIGYMEKDVHHNGDPERFRRFFIYLNLFIAAMMLLVSASSYVVLFVGWEGVGLCSYLLIGFWFEKGADGTGNAKAAKKAFIVNRIGDFGLLIAIFLIFSTFGVFNIETILLRAPQISTAMPGVMTAITLFMLLGVAGKSAQIPLYVWLPDAMAGPTPVSALIHAATMVTAGVYLIARSFPLFALAPDAQAVAVWIGAGTALLAATIAIGQFDIKKVLAYSTISQLGFMVAAASMGATTAAIFHLVTHAFFKALLFLSAGSVILGMEHGLEQAFPGGHSPKGFDPQDMRQMGGLKNRMKLTYWVYLIGALALAGIVPLAGFFSKDEILAAASQKFSGAFLLLIVAAFLTAFYMGRQVLMVFFGGPRSKAAQTASESPRLVTVPLVILAVLSALGGLINLPGVHWLETWLHHTFMTTQPEGFILWVAVLSLIIALSGIGIAWLLYGKAPLTRAVDPDPLAGVFFSVLESKWYVDEIYHALIIAPFERISGWLANWFDPKVIDGAVNGAGRATAWTAEIWRKLQNGFVRSYALTILVGVILLLGYLILR